MSQKIPFISIFQRFIIILQLCITFSLLLWYLAQPFMGEYFNLRSRMLLYEYVMGTSNAFNTSQTEKLQRNAQKWLSLPFSIKQEISEDYKWLQEYVQRPFITKIKEGIEILLTQIPSFELAWLTLATLLSILLLFKVEGAKPAAWLLPLIVLAYAVDNQMNGAVPKKPADANLFPTESFIVNRYLKGNLSSHPEEQRQQLQKGWHSYLSEHWASQQDRDRIEEGEFNFTVARLRALHSQHIQDWKSLFHKRTHPFLIILYSAWNILFARTMNKKKKGIKLAYIEAR